MGCTTRLNRIALTLVVAAAVGLWMDGPPAEAARPQSSKTFVVVGAGPLKGGDQNTAKAFAIEKAKLSAVGLMAAELLPLETLASQFQSLDGMVFQNPDAFIEDYRVLNELKTEGEYRVLVQATVSARVLADRLRGAGLMTDTAAGVELELTVQGTRDLPRFVQFRKSLSEMEGVEEVQMREMGADTAAMAVRWQGTGDSLADALVRQRYEGFGIRVYKTGDRALRVELVAQ